MKFKCWLCGEEVHRERGVESFDVFHERYPVHGACDHEFSLLLVRGHSIPQAKSIIKSHKEALCKKRAGCAGS